LAFDFSCANIVSGTIIMIINAKILFIFFILH
jgi:hypothetical protein